MAVVSDPRNRVLLISIAAIGIVALVALFWIGLPFLPTWLGAWGLAAFAAYGIDKHRATEGGWRIPEWALHAVALAGGVIGAWIGRYVFRHKTQKPVFTVVLVVASILWAVIAAWLLVG
jgi:uncharacterized membrane protein YsdA (DUF1294 family)